MKLKTIIILIILIIVGYSLFSNVQEVRSVCYQLADAFNELPDRVKHRKRYSSENWTSSSNLSDKEVLKRFRCPIRGDWIVTSAFGRRKIFGKSQFHEGIDLVSKGNDRVYAPFDGILTFKGKQSGYGNVVILKHSEGITTLYGHLRSFARISNGDKIGQHQRLGVIGSSGRSTGKHLHFEIRQDGKPINPRPYLRSW